MNYPNVSSKNFGVLLSMSSRARTPSSSVGKYVHACTARHLAGGATSNRAVGVEYPRDGDGHRRSPSTHAWCLTGVVVSLSRCRACVVTWPLVALEQVTRLFSRLATGRATLDLHVLDD
jgi:hypothetical protein